MLRYQEGSASTQARTGILDAIAEHPGIEVVSANQYGEATTETQGPVKNLLAAWRQGDQKLQIEGLFCPNESTTFGMLRALQDNGCAGKVKFVGFDSSAMLVQALAQGHIQGLVLQDPMNMGYLGVTAMVRHLRGQPVETRIDTGSVVVTPDNMREPQNQKLLNPDYAAWLKDQ